MISINNVTVDFGSKVLFDDVSFVISPKDRIALVGKNGAGKSTLLKLIMGINEPTSGNIACVKGITLGYLPQVMTFRENNTVYEECETAFGHIKQLEDEVDSLTEEMSSRTDYESESYQDLIQHFSNVTDKLSIFQTGNYHALIEKTLMGLGFDRTDFHRPTSEFSGGWRMRIELAKILLQKPDVLLLDEPTNHLDIESIQWLEKFIAGSSSALLLISHDRAFIDATTNRTIEIEMGRIYDYKTNYSHYVKLREERLEQQRRAYENQQKVIQDTEDFIERFRYKATKSVQVQSRIKQLEKIERIELDEIDRQAMHFKFIPAVRSGSYPVICEDLRKSYDDKIVFEHANITIKRGDKVAFVGKNGSGKSTMVKCIMGLIHDYQGELKIGHNVEIGYFSQTQNAELDNNLSIYETIDREAVGDIRLRINDLLGAFMFGGETAEKKVKVLSGGERGRLSIIKLLLKPANLLILDEPTNHLDMRSKDVLKEAISNFDGTVIVVSHDREFLDGLVSRVYEFACHTVIEHLGGIYDWINSKAALEADSGQTSSKNVTQSSDMSCSQIDYRKQKEEARAKKSLEKELKQIESDIERLDDAIKDIELKLQDPKNLTDGVMYKQYDALKKEQNLLLTKWEQISLSLG
ncbi:ABC-F family ATP-binding cassette domain-containing protein [Porphyromonas pogonae]|uniref:ABC-F family ATP-binding cassette domain-containing protein n=1 Tax=Porphyromonas pogonae TaxID=867595 RepID=UPI002E7745B9|nr:ABC-F family ATP-binding cassette domain-containing protein [Porphyromonas pogonae]